ncbi:MAG: 50S ribosomal protein L24 [Nitrososphaera sp.]|uniref:50S ribosomal protein L24 n=1 Tax=Nitrososphaera sp. TaxID=1971748 RepID=UPI0017C5DC91|nr:50S ribosomal protein L24 [Nitrososphaera sp.]NWG37617.1 50S ribosomal protein L24 [Nitrososphaera sp.]
MTQMNPKLLHVPKHQLDKMVGSTLSDSLRQQYGRRSARVIKGDSVRVMRGEYKGVEGKVDRVNVKFGTLIIEGIQHEKVKGGQVKVPIHASKVMITSVKTDDKLRFAGTSPKEQPAAESKAEAATEAKAAPKPAKVKAKAKPKKTAKKAKKVAKKAKAAKKKGASK